MDRLNWEGLRSIPLWARLPAASLAAIAHEAQVCAHKNRTVIFREGESCTGLHFVRTGQVKLSTCNGDREQLLAILGAGEPLDLVPLLDGRPHAVTASARGSVTVFVISQDLAHDLIWNNPPVLATALRLLSTRLHDLVSLAHDLAVSDVTARVCRLLLAQARTQGAPDHDGIHLKPGLTQGELASLTGTSREVAWRSLKKLEEDGFIRIDGRHIIILDMERLVTRVQAIH